jgi:MFS family permease
MTVRRTVARPASGARPQGGLAIVRRDALLAPLFVLLALLVLIGSMVNVVNVFLVRDTLHASTTWYGIVGASFAVGMLLGALSAGRLSGQPALARGFVAATVLLACGLAGAGAAPSVGWLLPICVATGVGNGVLNVTLSSLVMGRAREAERGRVGAVLNGVASGTQLVAFAGAGLAASVLSPRAIFVLAGLLALSAPVLFGHRLVRAADADRADSAVMSAASAA